MSELPDNLSLPEVTDEHVAVLAATEQVIGYRFKRREILLKALIHPSMRDIVNVSYERLEFLGDAVLGLVIAEHLFQKFPSYDEGELTRIKSAVVSRASLARIGRRIEINEKLIVGKGILRQSSVLPRSVTANATEALIGAIYLDGGLDEARRFVLHHLTESVEHSEAPRRSRNYKSMLQHLTQGLGQGTPTYRLLSVEGPDHERRFEVCAVMGQRTFPPANGPSKKVAEQRAARNALKLLEPEQDEPTPPAST